MNKLTGIPALLLSMTLLCACTPTALTVKAPTQQPATLPPMVESLQLLTSPFSEEGQTPNYKIMAQIPYLNNPSDARIQAFNTRLKTVSDDAIAAFKKDLAQEPAAPISAGSSFDLRYDLIGQRGGIWSVKFSAEVYMDGAAHPYHYSIPLNYDLEDGRELALDELFVPGSNYLELIADYCKTELSGRDIGFDGFSQGADPTNENYRNWNISDDGILITFDEYQVAPYVAGPQTVVIPFDTLREVVNPQGVLAPFMK